MSAIVGIHRTVTARQAAADTSGAGKADEATVSIGMAVALGALTMTFAALLLAYAIVRVQTATWPPPGEAPVPRSWPWLLSATFAALAGSAAMYGARRNVAGAAATVDGGGGGGGGLRGRVRRALVAAAGAGTTFIAIQVCGWRWLIASGVRPNSGMVASVVYALTLFHALHAFAALVLLLPILFRAVRGGAVGASALAALSSFWHLVTVLWIVVCLAVFVA